MNRTLIAAMALVLIEAARPGTVTRLLALPGPGDHSATATPGLLQAQQPQQIFIGRRARDSGSVSPGTADLVADVVEGTMSNAVRNRLPCYEAATQTGVATVLGWERAKALLGVGDDDALSRVAGSVGARYLVALDVSSFGDGRTAISASAFDITTGKKLAMQVTSIQTEDFEIAELEQLADKLLNGLSGSLRRCPPTTDIVTITDQSGGSGRTPDGASISTFTSLNMNCTLDRQTESEASCKVSYTSGMTASDGNRSTEKAEGTITCALVVDVGARTTRLHVGMFRMTTQQQATLVIKDADGKVHRHNVSGTTGQVELGGWDFDGPARPAASGGVSGSGSFGTIKATWTVKSPFGS